ncbi:MAG: lipopolysaccharide core heptose(I) kinase RfaP [Lentisphaerae bacterium]|nr:lipopolysaccharide core heptose(I) kinase RfaP [Lentisphaerota bacterium]MBQ4329995.1 lipopolysaccharide core heptose(I) kinase RfaP [Lentisphaeria bacterium]
MSRTDLRTPFDTLWHGKDVFAEVFALEGEEFRNVKNRRTFRIEVNGKGFFVKIHRGIGWKEIFKNIFQFKLPVTGAGNEYNALEKLHLLGIATMDVAAFAERNLNPAAKESFLITRELTGVISLEDLVKETELSFVSKKKLIEALGESSGKMHRAGINHRDCYICHYLLHKDTLDSSSPRLSVIDLHRAQIRKKVPFRYQVKDTAGLLFSSFDVPLSKKDIFRFIKAYSGRSLREELKENSRFYQAVYRTACKLYLKESGTVPAADPFAGKTIQR